MKSGLWLAVLFLVSALVAACGDDDGGSGASCVDLCTEAQAAQCTSITGNCSAFCGAVDNLQGPSGCTDERNAYQACLNVGLNVCDNNCDALENTMGQCLLAYCMVNTSNADCQTIVASF